jgi:hypothetical protein
MNVCVYSVLVLSLRQADHPYEESYQLSLKVHSSRINSQLELAREPNPPRQNHTKKRRRYFVGFLCFLLSTRNTVTHLTVTEFAVRKSHVITRCKSYEDGSNYTINRAERFGWRRTCVVRRPLTAPSVEVKEQIDQWIWTTKKSVWYTASGMSIRNGRVV